MCQFFLLVNRLFQVRKNCTKTVSKNKEQLYKIAQREPVQVFTAFLIKQTECNNKPRKPPRPTLHCQENPQSSQGTLSAQRA